MANKENKRFKKRMSSCRQFLQYLVAVNACIFTFSKISCFAESTAVCPALNDHHVCSEDLCQNGGKCVQDDAGIRCHCNEGYKGLMCQKDINECASNPCLNGGKCFDGCNTYWCKCASGYSGHRCQNEFDVCSADLCQNGGTCVGGDEGVRCQCNVGYKGLRCEKDINECSPNPCFHGGKCVDGCNTYWCYCTSGFSGHRCQNGIDKCISNPCLNGGTCRDSIDSFSCQCKKGYKGKLCQDDNICALKPCLHGSLCIPEKRPGKYSCECKKGLSGKNCEQNIDDCWWQPCQNRGTCVDGIDSYTCKCRGGFTGKYCEIDIDECASKPCPRRAICIQGRGKHTCKCNRGYSGKNCDIDECASYPCQNGAICEQGINTYRCFCKKGFTGIYCQKVLKEDIKELGHSSFSIAETFIIVFGLAVSLLPMREEISFFIRYLTKKVLEGVLTFCMVLVEKVKIVIRLVSHLKDRIPKRQVTQVVEDMSECIICCSAETDAEIVPCGHRICHKCFHRIKESGQTCPFCRSEIETMIRLVKSSKVLEGMLTICRVLVKIVEIVIRLVSRLKDRIPKRQVTQVVEDMSECKICCSAESDAEIVPCGHIICPECFLRITELGKQCPFCRGEIKTMIPLVKSSKGSIFSSKYMKYLFIILIILLISLVSKVSNYS